MGSSIHVTTAVEITMAQTTTSADIITDAFYPWYQFFINENCWNNLSSRCLGIIITKYTMALKTTASANIYPTGTTAIETCTVGTTSVETSPSFSSTAIILETSTPVMTTAGTAISDIIIPGFNVCWNHS